MYCKLRNHAKLEEKRLKSNHFCNLIKESKSDSEWMWSFITKVLPTIVTQELTNLVYKSKSYSTAVDIAAICNLHFSNVGYKLSKAFGCVKKVVLPQPCNIVTKFDLKPVSKEFVHDQLCGLKGNRAIGLDNISPRLLKDVSDVILPVLTKLINRSIEQCHFPNNWKSAKVVALFEAGDQSDCNNYHPISILPTVSKIIERAVHSQFYAYLCENKLLLVRQFSFWWNRSTTSALLQFTDELLRNMDHGKVNGIVYLDIKKAFDTVNHVILLQKLKWIDVDSNSLQWLWLTIVIQPSVKFLLEYLRVA